MQEAGHGDVVRGLLVRLRRFESDAFDVFLAQAIEHAPFLVRSDELSLRVVHRALGSDDALGLPVEAFVHMREQLRDRPEVADARRAGGQQVFATRIPQGAQGDFNLALVARVGFREAEADGARLLVSGLEFEQPLEPEVSTASHRQPRRAGALRARAVSDATVSANAVGWFALCCRNPSIGSRSWRAASTCASVPRW